MDDWQLSNLYGYRDKIPALLAAMKQYARAPTTASLGPLGREHLLSRLAEAGYGMEDGRDWYKRAEVAVDGIPWVAEVLVLESDEKASYWLMTTPS